MAQITNSFSQGMDKDSSKNKYDTKHYYDANNVRIASQNGLSAGALEIIQGNLERIDINPPDGDRYYIIGGTVLRDDLILFLTDNIYTSFDSTVDHIMRIAIADIEALTGTDVITLDYDNYHVDPTDSYNLLYTGSLGFSTNRLIQAIPRYENEYVQKVYWIDGGNSFRYLNTVYDADTNDLENLPIDHLEAVTDFELTQPVITQTTGGDLDAGKIQYAYQLYILNGSKTAISPPSSLIHLTNSSDDDTNSLGYSGSELDENVGKGVEIEISLDSTTFTRLRLFAIHYSTYDGEPEIRVVTEIPIIVGDDSITIIDTGQSVSTSTLEEFRTFAAIFSPTTIETKDNILFLGDVEEESFDVDYDARAYRYGGAGLTTSFYNYNPASTRYLSVLYNTDGTYYAIYPANAFLNHNTTTIDGFDLDNRLFNGLTYMIIGQTTTDFTNYGAADNELGTVFECSGYPDLGIGDSVKVVDGYILYDDLSSVYIVDEIPDTADCINRGNNMDYDVESYDRVWNQRYQSDGKTLGGEGTNISYTFTIEEIEICQNQVTELGTWVQTPLKRELIEGSTDNFSYTGYSSPINSGNLVGYQRDETYRFGIVFFNIKGQSSFVKWIGDIRMPSINAEDTATSETFGISAISDDAESVMGRILNVEFTIDNIPDDATHYQIVRVDRTDSDRSIVAQGMTVNAQHNDSWDTTEYRTCFTWGSIGYLYDDACLEFFSPEIGFLDIVEHKAATDHILAVGEIIGTVAGGYCTGIPDDIDNVTQWTYATYTQQTADEEFDDNNITSCVGETIHEDLEDPVIFDDDGNTFDPKGNSSQQSTCLYVFMADTSFPARGTYQNERWLCNYRRNNYLSRYGGITYATRSQNEYQVASDIASVSDTSVISNLGDTYVNMTENLITSLQNGETQTADTSFVFFVCESTVNVNLRGDSSYEFTPNDSRYLLHEYSGEWMEGLTEDTFVQENDYYSYNKVYSKQSDLVLFTPKPFDWRSIEKFDTRVYASSTKTNGEEEDSWLDFPTSQYIEVDSQFGPITALKNVNNKLLFFQTQAFGVLSVNDRALIETSDVSQLSLGVADLLDRYDYAKTGIGCSNWRQVVSTPNGLYWVDLLNRAMFKYSGGPEELSLMKGLNSWFKSNVVNEDSALQNAMHIYYDPEFKEIHLIDNSLTDPWGLIFNELTDSFVSFTDLQPCIVINYFDKILSYKTDKSTTSLYDSIYKHNDSEGQKGNFYDSWYDMSITHLINPSNSNIAIFNIFEWLTESFYTDSKTGLVVNQAVTFDKIQMWNDYQNTGEITLTVNSNVKRRMRKWRFTIPRAKFETDGVTELSEKHARMRDSYMLAKFTYTPDETDDKSFIVHDIITSFTTSNK